MPAELYSMVSVVYILSCNSQIITLPPSWVARIGIVGIFSVFNQTEAVKTPSSFLRTFQTVYCNISGVVTQCSNCRGVGGLNPLPHLVDPLPLVKIRPRGVEFRPPHLSFAEVGMLLDSHFLLMQFLKYLGLHHNGLNVTTS